LNSNADVGNSFHHGYILVACAVTGKIDHAFVNELGPACDAIYFDVAYDLNFDSLKNLSSFFLALAKTLVRRAFFCLWNVIFWDRDMARKLE